MIVFLFFVLFSFDFFGRNFPKVLCLLALVCFNYLNGATKHTGKEIGCVRNFKSNAIYQSNQRVLRLNIDDIRLSLRCFQK